MDDRQTGGFPPQSSAFPLPPKVLNVAGVDAVRTARSVALTRAGFAVTDAAGGVEALRRLEEFTPETVILNLPLPDSDTLELCRHVRLRPVRVILIAAEIPFDARLHIEALASGADACLPDPNPDLLVAAANSRLRGVGYYRQLEAALEETADNVMILDRDWRFSYLNARARRDLAGGRDVIGQVLWDALPAAAADRFGQEYREAAATAVPRHFEEYDAAREAWLEVQAHPCEAGLIVFLRDVSARKRIEIEREMLIRSLGESEQRTGTSRSQLEAVFEAIEDGVVVFDLQTDVVMTNAGLARLAGKVGVPSTMRSLRDFAGMFDLRNLNGEAPPPDLLPVPRALRGQSFTDCEMRVRRRDTGQEWIFSFSGQPILDASGRQVRAVLVLRDITDRKRAEEQMLQAQKLEGIGLLAGGIAHDFNNLLASVIGYASLLEEEVPGQSLEKVQAILQASQRAADLTRQLLAYAGKGSFVVQRIDLTRLVRETLQLLQTSISKKIRVEEDLMPGLPAVEADIGQIQQIVMNLALNAAEAIPENQPGTVAVRTSVEDIERGGGLVDDLSHAAIPPGRYVCLEVRDTGTGMDEATKSKAFDPFFTTKFTGRGLGLAAVSGIVRAHRGAIRILSTPGAGTCFRVYLPADVPRGPRMGPTLTATLLVVDDEPMVRAFAQAALERAGYHVLAASGGREALAIAEARAEEIDLVLLDLIMPDMRGDEVAGNFGRSFPHIPVVVMSGYGESEAAKILSGKTVAGFLQKPFPASHIVQLIDTILRARRLPQQ